MKIYLDKNVFDAAIERMEYLFDEFPNVIVGFSGGKDSTVILNLAIEVARRKNRLPVNVLFLDQEAEWTTVIDYIRTVMHRPEVKPYWFQMPFRLSNGASYDQNWLDCWSPGKEWIRDKEPDSYHENVYGTITFAKLFEMIPAKLFPDTKTCYFSGVRAEESPTRSMSLTGQITYKDITYGKVLNKKLEHYTFYPLYDWSWTDIWKSIHDNKWNYCKLYDYMYQYGVPINNMRVSSLSHETALGSLFYLQEIEGDTWNKIVDRLQGANTFSHFTRKQFYVKELPYMFDSYLEYREYLLENLIQKPEQKKLFRDKFDALDKMYIHKGIKENMLKECINALFVNDYHMTKIGNFERRPEPATYRHWRQGKPVVNPEKNKWIKDAINNPIK